MPVSHRTRAALRRALPAFVPLLLAPASLAAQESLVHLDGNEFSCVAVHTGNLCDPQFGQGIWPAGTNDQYLWSAGLVVAGIVSSDAGFTWAGDTSFAQFFSRSGHEHGTPVAGIFASDQPQDLAVWPGPGVVPGFPFASAFLDRLELFSPVHEGARSLSDLDTWTLYWEGDPTFLGQREHPLGLAVEQRTMQFNDPHGIGSTIFVVYRITNVTNLPVFREANAAFFDGDASAFPAAGWRIDSVFVGLNVDADVANDPTENFSFLQPAFGIAGAYHALFQATYNMTYPPDEFYPPFFADAPGIFASALLYADAPEHGSQTRQVSEYEDNFGCFECDRAVVAWHMLSGHQAPGLGIPACSFQDAIAAGICYLRQTPTDIYNFQSVGPWSLDPGESATVIYALVVAPPVETSEITIGAENPPGIPSIAPGCDGDLILPIEIAAGWSSTPVCPAAGERVDPDLVETVPGSLLHRIQIARAMVREGFIQPFAPEAPDFFLVPSDSAVHVVWERSATDDDASGDPYWNVARDSTSALYNPNYRRNDVEGYRVYRSIDGENWELRAQFDYSGFYVDMLCETDDEHVAGAACTETVEVPTYDYLWAGDPGYFVQYRPGDVLETAQGQAIVVGGDTASAGYFRLDDNEPYFAFTDTDVRAGFRYFYQVRAFDLNSYRSGPSSLESDAETKSIVVQADFANRGDATFTMRLEGADGTVLDPAAPLPTLDPETGIFSGPMPPTNGIEAYLQPLIEDLLPDFRLTITIDSVSLIPNSACPPGVYGGGTVIPQGACWHVYVRADEDGAVTQDTVVGFTPLWDSFLEPGSFETLDTVAQLQYDSTRLAEGAAPPDALGFNAVIAVEADEAIFNSTWEGQANRRSNSPGTHHAGGSRWFAGTTETVPDPTASIRVGDLPGIDTIWSPDVHHTRAPGQFSGFPNSAAMQQWGYSGFAQIGRAADFRVTWQNGTITVEDVTHHVPVPFDPSPTGQSWSFVPDGNDNGMIDDYDFMYLAGVADIITSQAGAGFIDASSAEPGSATPIIMPTDIRGVEPGAMLAGANGFGLLLNGQRFIFRPTNGQAPANGTVWTLRTYHGLITATDADTPDPSAYQFVASGSAGTMNGILQIRPPFVPGLRVVFEGTAASFEAAADLSRVHAVPDPYYFHSTFGATAQDRGRVLRFVNVPPAATIRIYSLTGILVDVIHHDDPASGIATWDLRTRDGNTAAPGVYFFHVTAPGSDEHLGRFTIVTSGRVVE